MQGLSLLPTKDVLIGAWHLDGEIIVQMVVFFFLSLVYDAHMTREP